MSEEIEELLKQREWYDRNLNKLQTKFSGKVIGIHNQSVVADGESYEEVLEKIKEKDLDERRVLIIKVPEGKIETAI